MDPQRPKKKRWQPTESQLKEIETLSGYGLNHEKLAAFYKVSKSTFERAWKYNTALREAILRGDALAIGRVTQSAYEMAVSKKCPALTIFYLKCRARWSPPKDQSVIEHKGLISDAPDKQAREVIDEFKKLLDEANKIPKEVIAEAARGLVPPTPPAYPVLPHEVG